MVKKCLNCVNSLNAQTWKQNHQNCLNEQLGELYYLFLRTVIMKSMPLKRISSDPLPLTVKEESPWG